MTIRPDKVCFSGHFDRPQQPPPPPQQQNILTPLRFKRARIFFHLMFLLVKLVLYLAFCLVRRETWPCFNLFAQSTRQATVPNTFWALYPKNVFKKHFFTHFYILGDPGADSGGERKSKRAEKYGTKKSKERREESLLTMSYQTSSKRSPPFCLLIGQKNTKVFWHQTKLRKSETLNWARATAQRRQTLSTRDRGYTATTNM